MNLNIREMISGNPIRLRYVFRYSTSRVGCPESVAEHSFFVAFFCLLIGRWVEGAYEAQPEKFALTCISCGIPTPRPNMEVLLERALVHDLEEARSGDVPRPFKYSSPELRELLERASREAFKQVLDDVVVEPPSGDGGCYDYSDRDILLEVWETAKDNSMEGRILAFADFLAVLGFMVQEAQHGGNRSIAHHMKDMDVYFAGFSKHDYDFLRPLVDQAAELIKEIF